MIEGRSSQLHDYCSQLLALSGKGALPKITQTLIANRLNVSPSGVSSFINNKTKKSKKMLDCFEKRYPAEFIRWPQGSYTIERVVRVAEALYFYRGGEYPPRVISRRSEQLKHKFRAPLPILKATPLMILPTATKTQTLKTGKVVRITPPQKAPIAISYRGHASEKDAQGTLFDHMRYQVITDYPTMNLEPQLKTLEKKIMDEFLEKVLSQHPIQLQYGDIKRGLIVPPSIFECAELGLLIIPGRARAVENEPIRLRHEYSVIRAALNRGQPILAICAGVWRVWEQMFTWTRYPDFLNFDANRLSNWHSDYNTLIDATDHTNSSMISLNVKGVDVAHNTEIHDVELVAGSLLEKAMKDPSCRNKVPLDPFSVNSVHWKVVNENEIPDNVMINARSQENPKLTRKNRNKNVMHPQENCPEGFEATDGTPIMGIQWHAEGYDIATLHGNLIEYMAAAGTAYSAKRLMLKEMMEKNMERSYASAAIRRA